MRIISKDKDYYDYMLKYEDSHDPLYIRKSVVKLYSKKDYPLSRGSFNRVSFKGYNYGCPQIIGFCGKLYPFLELRQYGQDRGDFVYNVRRLLPIVNKYDKEYVEKFFDPKHEEYAELFEEYPIFCAGLHNSWYKGAGDYEIEFNCRLKNYEFYKVKSGIVAFNELKQWLCNKANPVKEIPEVSDEDMIQAKGFDLRFSFRKGKKRNANNIRRVT